MNCKNCGAPLQENALFCGNCGMKVEAEQPVYEQPVYEQPVYEEPVSEAGEYSYQEQGSYTAPVQPAYNEPAPAYVGEKPNTVLWIVLSAIQMLSCCTVTGVISLIFSILGHAAADKGNYEEANKKLKTAKISFWVGLGLFVVFFIVYILFVVVLGLAASDPYSSSYYYY